jgi:hypothetical protein
MLAKTCRLPVRGLGWLRLARAGGIDLECDFAQLRTPGGCRLLVGETQRDKRHNSHARDNPDCLSHLLGVERAHVDGAQSQGVSCQCQVLHGQSQVVHEPVAFVCRWPVLFLKVAGLA